MKQSPQHHPAACSRAATALEISSRTFLRPVDIRWQQADTGPAVQGCAPRRAIVDLSSWKSSVPTHRQMLQKTVANMTLQIDDAFIRKWDPKYGETKKDEPEYQRLTQVVHRDMESRGTISWETFQAIWAWKKAMRVKRYVRECEYDTRYAESFRLAASEPPERKLDALLTPGKKLPGVGAATGSTIIHFMHPESMPIIDVRTVEVLFEAGCISTKQRDLGHYEEFRKAIECIKHRCPSRTLRQIDRALFAYHKQVLAKKGRDRNCRMH